MSDDYSNEFKAGFQKGYDECGLNFVNTKALLEKYLVTISELQAENNKIKEKLQILQKTVKVFLSVAQDSLDAVIKYMKIDKL